MLYAHCPGPRQSSIIHGGRELLSVVTIRCLIIAKGRTIQLQVIRCDNLMVQCTSSCLKQVPTIPFPVQNFLEALPRVSRAFNTEFITVGLMVDPYTITHFEDPRLELFVI